MLVRDSKRKRNRVVVIVSALIVLGMMTTIAYAGYGYGNTLKFSSGGKSYTGQSYVFTNTWAHAVQQTKCNSSSAASGWIGNKARLYTSAGNLKGSSSWGYNSSSVAKGKYCLKTWSFDSKKGATFYSKGQSRGWNTKNSSYTTKTTPRSPNQTSN